MMANRERKREGDWGAKALGHHKLFDIWHWHWLSSLFAFLLLLSLASSSFLLF